MPDVSLAILSTPKPTTTSFYLLNKEGKPDTAVNYDTDNATIRGRKFYRHQGRAVPEEYRGKESDQNRTIHNALNSGATFKFTLDFENLAPLELGALLYTIELKEEMLPRLGYAKPLGFGSIKITISDLQTIDWSDRLNSLDLKAGWSSEDKTIYKKMFIEEMQKEYGIEFNNLLDDLSALLTAPPALPIHYPRITSGLDPNHPQFEWFVMNKRLRRDGIALKLAKDDKEGLPYSPKIH